ncbi:methyltransferase domain-containing protein [Pedobacter changchengzhani]|uniref:tRNA1(Val) (adenine(37)-N6)-methyltransferase n=1 Tax=Pedobacter changchengzhani TaxID=2529274 RepID=A0A4R5MMJ4_9SPHI|nr:methyltransferase [Pedobacter changchengzhani]TDG36505.1 methyltransferase domain-containing protein [Pedobacter changchengzhani]
MSIFKFKQFDVNQSNCAMKINTDGVLLATLVESDNPKYILDIGTGTGVLALMMAQRFPMALVEAVEIDENASATAEKNFQLSAFSNRLSINNIPIEQYNNKEHFDLIISNPPFFVNDLKNIEQKKGIARHTNEEFFVNLIKKVDALLSGTGSFWFILPIKQAKLLIKDALEKGLILAKKIELHSDESKPAFRWIVCLARNGAQCKTEHFYIYEGEKVYTQSYKDLLKDFFLQY